MKKSLLLFGLLLVSIIGNAQTYWTRVRVVTPNVSTLGRLVNSDLNIMNCIPVLGSNDVIVPPGGLQSLIRLGLPFSVIGPIEDPTKYAERHGERIQADYRLNYLNADEILAFYENLRMANLKYVSRKRIGTTINGEAMWAYRIGHQMKRGIVGNADPTQNIVCLFLIHAREWISGSVGMYLATQVLEGFKANPTGFMGNQALWIVPIHNPDGYRYTWTNNRLWRKNRRNTGGGNFGVDLNRNYAKGFGLNGGSSSNRSSEVYKGTAAFSEPESAAVRDFVAGLPNVAGMIDFHSYSQIVLWPWGYTTASPPDAGVLNTVCEDVRAGMSTLGAGYVQGQTSNILYIASGTTNDYVYDLRRTPCICIELRDTGDFGFELPGEPNYPDTE